MSFLKTLVADVRSAFVAMLLTGAVFILGPVGAAAWKVYAREYIPWTIFIVVVCVGIVLVLVAIRLTKKFPVLTEEKLHELQERHQKALSQSDHIPKRPIQVAYDRLLMLIQRGAEMLSSLKLNRPPIPTEQDVSQWSHQLDEVAACCASVLEREQLKHAAHEIGFAAAVEARWETQEEYGSRIIELLGKLSVANDIADRIKKEDKA